MRILPVPVNSDNYAYLISCNEGETVVAIDPAEPDKIVEALAANFPRTARIRTILTTHKHWDHAGGNRALLQLLDDDDSTGPPVRVVGGLIDEVEACNVPVRDGDVLNDVIPGVTVTCIHTPGHTRGHICYFLEEEEGKTAVFTGDTLFIGGCGKFFEGTANEMYPSLQKLASLPADTEVWCGHEYTLSNYKFARSVEPANEALRERDVWAKEQIHAGRFTIPSSIANELATNPFMRSSVPAIVEAVGGGDDPVTVLQQTRNLKDDYRGNL